MSTVWCAHAVSVCVRVVRCACAACLCVMHGQMLPPKSARTNTHTQDTHRNRYVRIKVQKLASCLCVDLPRCFSCATCLQCKTTKYIKTFHDDCPSVLFLKCLPKMLRDFLSMFRCFYPQIWSGASDPYTKNSNTKIQKFMENMATKNNPISKKKKTSGNHCAPSISMNCCYGTGLGR